MSAGGVQKPPSGSVFTMTLAPASPPLPLPGHTFAANTNGLGFGNWGAGIGLDLNNDGVTVASYDASKFKGFCLWARVGPGADTGGQTVRFKILDGNTTPQGGVCSPDSTSPNYCYDGFGANLSLTPAWQLFKFTWSALKQQAWGHQEAAIQPSKLYSVQFETGATDAFDTWLFGLEFF
jgi:hypothetical protein